MQLSFSIVSLSSTNLIVTFTGSVKLFLIEKSYGLEDRPKLSFNGVTLLIVIFSPLFS